MGPVVLYIDDDRDNLTVLEATCEGELEVVTAQSGAEGLTLMGEHEVAVVLADQRMPGLSGIDVLERARGLAPDAVRVLITAYANLTEAIAAINRGAVERYIRKPWNAPELIAALKDGVVTYEMRRKIRAMDRRLVETERVYALGVVAASVAHELRGPLSGVTGLVGLLRLRRRELATHLEAGRFPEARAVAADLEDLVEQLGTAVDQTVDISRAMELGQRQADTGPVDLREVVTLTTRMLRTEIVRTTELEVALADDLPYVLGSRHRLGQVVLNLLVNALQALPPDGRADNRIALRARRGGDDVELEVEDNGRGIPAEHLDRIFDPFFTTKSEGGTGLGLAISRRIVEELGGTILVQSRPGCTRFIVSIPAIPRA